jgi:NhaP-type Na+/H+ or K+/H+ antiporter
MDVITALAALLFAWSLVSARVERLDVTGPIVFVAAGLVLANGPLEILDVSIQTSAVHHAAEFTLALILFADAAQVDPRDLWRHSGVPFRLVVLGTPLAIAAGFGVAAALFTDLPWQLAALLGAVLAPTDAALSSSIVGDERLPEDLRRSLNVESGLNDGVATPVVTLLIAGAATVIGAGTFEDDASPPGMSALIDLAGGAAVGVAVGLVGGELLRRARGAGWIEVGGRRVAVLMLAVLAFTVSAHLGVNYFVAAFVAGAAFRWTISAEAEEEAIELPELLGRVLSLSVWFVFGAALLLDGLRAVDWRIALYAVLSLTVVRMAAVAVALLGSGTDRWSTLFVGWFGPRGLASVVFGLLIVEELPVGDPGVQTVLSATVLTVVLSVLAHGVTGRPLAGWFSRRPAGAIGRSGDR